MRRARVCFFPKQSRVENCSLVTAVNGGEFCSYIFGWEMRIGASSGNLCFEADNAAKSCLSNSVQPVAAMPAKYIIPPSICKCVSSYHLWLMKWILKQQKPARNLQYCEHTSSLVDGSSSGFKTDLFCWIFKWWFSFQFSFINPEASHNTSKLYSQLFHRKNNTDKNSCFFLQQVQNRVNPNLPFIFDKFVILIFHQFFIKLNLNSI